LGLTVATAATQERATLGYAVASTPDGAGPGRAIAVAVADPDRACLWHVVAPIAGQDRACLWDVVTTAVGHGIRSHRRHVQGAGSSTLLVRRSRWYADGLGWGFVVGGLAAAGGALYLHGRAADLAGDVAPAMDEDRRLEQRDAAYVRGITGTVLGIAGAVLLAGAVTRLVIRAGRRTPALTGSTPPRDASAPVLTRGGMQTPASSARWGLGISRHGAAVLGRF